LRRVYRFIVKEVKELLRDRYVLFAIILAPLIVSPLMLGVSYVTVRQASGALEQALKKLPEDVAVVLEDPNDEVAKNVALKLGVRIEYSVDGALGKHPIVIILHSGFANNILEGRQAKVTIISKVERPFNVFEVAVRSAIVAGLSDVVTAVLAEMFNLNPQLIKSPILAESKILYRGEIVDEFRLTLIYMISTGLAFAVFILGAVALQVGVISIGVEREAKTLELLLTLPISKLELVAGKVLGVSIVSLMGFASFLAGFSLSVLVAPLLLADVLTESPGGVAGAPTTVTLPSLINAFKNLSPATTALIVLSIALAMIASTIAGVLAGVLLAGDIRGALVLGSYVSLILAIPLLAEIMGAPPPMPLQVAFLISPMYPPFKTAQSALAGEASATLAYAIATLANITLLLLLTTLSMKSERLIYGIRLRKAGERGGQL
jgi:ABC-2 type transport system permease protein